MSVTRSTDEATKLRAEVDTVCNKVATVQSEISSMKSAQKQAAEDQKKAMDVQSKTIADQMKRMQDMMDKMMMTVSQVQAQNASNNPTQNVGGGRVQNVGNAPTHQSVPPQVQATSVRAPNARDIEVLDKDITWHKFTTWKITCDSFCDRQTLHK